MSRWVVLIGLIGGAVFLYAGFSSTLPWGVAGPIAGVLLGSWFGGEIKKRIDKASEKGKETRVIRFKQKAALEMSVSELRSDGWEPKWESYRETPTGLLIRRIMYSVVMERKQKIPPRVGIHQFNRLLTWIGLKKKMAESNRRDSDT